MEAVEREQQHESECARRSENNQRGATALGDQVQKVRESNGREQHQRGLRRNRERERDAEQHDSLPVPQHYFARRIERVRDGDGSEDHAKGAPGGDDRGLHGRGALQQRRREHVERECDEAAGIAEEAAGYVPQRRAQKQANEDEGQARPPAPGTGRRAEGH